MKMQVFAVYDTKAQYFGNPVITRTKAEAIRGFSDASLNEQTEIGKHPEDFCLFHLGEYDNDKGIFENLKAPESIGLALEFRQKLVDEGKMPNK